MKPGTRWSEASVRIGANRRVSKARSSRIRPTALLHYGTTALVREADFTSCSSAVGLTTSTFLTLIILPTVYSYMDDVSRGGIYLIRLVARLLSRRPSTA